MLESNITAVVDATQVGLFAEPFLVILACIFAGVKIVRKLINRVSTKHA